MPGLREYRYFLDDLESELCRIESLRASGAAGGCRIGCTDCCLPLTLLPLEAYAILSQRDSSRKTPAVCEARQNACHFLSAEGTCVIYAARPFLCRTRGYPILHMNGDGEWEADSCAKRGFSARAAGSVGLSLETWNARLFRLNEDFCLQNGISPTRLRLAELYPSQIGAPSPGCR